MPWESCLPCALQSTKGCQVLGVGKLQAENMERDKTGKLCLAVALHSCAFSIVWHLTCWMTEDAPRYIVHSQTGPETVTLRRDIT